MIQLLIGFFAAGAALIGIGSSVQHLSQKKAVDAAFVHSQEIPLDFSAQEVEFENVDDESLSSSTSTTASSTNGRIRWSQYWLPFTEEERRRYGSWRRAPGPARVALQAGHWQVDDVPEELSGLKGSTGARGGGYTEQELVLDIARRTKALLEKDGVLVELLPATIPVDYTADAFISIHADGNASSNVSGFKIAAPRGDFSGWSDDLVEALYASYDEATGLRQDPNITRRMNGYYAFNWRRYDHALHPMTPAAIVETGFVTSPRDRAILVDDPDRAAEGIANGIRAFLEKRGL